jgi:hypothetical protein
MVTNNFILSLLSGIEAGFVVSKAVIWLTAFSPGWIVGWMVGWIVAWNYGVLPFAVFLPRMPWNLL